MAERPVPGWKSTWPDGVSLLNDRIVEAIATTGCYVGASIIPADLVIALRGRAQILQAQRKLHLAQVGRAGTLSTTMELINSLRAALNKALYIGAMDTECHYARYPAGTFYKTHLDRFGNHDLRVVSLVFYLNARWQDHQGGELLIHHPNGNPERVLPRCGTMVAFLSAQFPHEVLPATRPRLALTGWMRRRALVRQ